jgi:hypothetical protein
MASCRLGVSTPQSTLSCQEQAPGEHPDGVLPEYPLPEYPQGGAQEDSDSTPRLRPPSRSDNFRNAAFGDFRRFPFGLAAFRTVAVAFCEFPYPFFYAGFSRRVCLFV